MTKKKDNKKSAKDTRKTSNKKPAAAKAVKAKAPAGPATFLARVYVSLKPTVNDPEGITIGSALSSLGFESVTGVRSGRFFQVTLTAADTKDAVGQVDQMCSRLLANPVIEMYSFEVVKA